MKEFLLLIPDPIKRVFYAVVILAAGFLLIKLIRKLMLKAFESYSVSHPQRGQGRTVQSLVTSLFNAISCFSVVLAALSALGVDISSLLAVAGVGSVALGFGCQTLVKDYISGMFLWFDGSCNVGDIVTAGGQTGEIVSVGLRTTTLKNANGSLFVIPNGEIRTVVNMSSDFRSAVVDVTVAHGQDYTRALNVLETAMSAVNKDFDFIDEDPKVSGYISMDGRAATVRIECRCPVDRCWQLERGIRLAALEAFRKENIKP